MQVVLGKLLTWFALRVLEKKVAKIQEKNNHLDLKAIKQACRWVEEVKLHLSWLLQVTFYFRELQENSLSRTFATAAAAASKHADQTAAPSQTGAFAGNICVCAHRHAWQ